MKKKISPAANSSIARPVPPGARSPLRRQFFSSRNISLCRCNRPHRATVSASGIIGIGMQGSGLLRDAIQFARRRMRRRLAISTTGRHTLAQEIVGKKIPHHASLQRFSSITRRLTASSPPSPIIGTSKS